MYIDTFMIIYWALLGVIIYVYIGYPIICLLGATFFNKHVLKDESYCPFITLIISAYNEEDVIKDKLANTLELDYPRDKMECMVVSDGSSDRTCEMVEEFASSYAFIKLLDFKKNRGKTTVQNDAVKIAKGEVIVFSDANAMYEKDALKKIVRNYYDPSVGCVCGELRYVDGNSAINKGEGLYWRYEQFLKQAESKIGIMLGANGSIYAVRKDLYFPLGHDIISDFVEPIKIVEKGYRAVYEKEAISYEDTSSSYESEFQRKVRIITRGYRGLWSVKNILNPFRYGFLSIALISHRLLRWYTSFFLIFLFIINIILVIKLQGIYLIILVAQLIFYLLALAGYISKTKSKIMFVPAYFCVVNCSSLLGIYNYYRGDRAVSWKPVRGK